MYMSSVLDKYSGKNFTLFNAKRGTLEALGGKSTVLRFEFKFVDANKIDC